MSAEDRRAATERVLQAVRADVDPHDEDLMLCHPSAITLAQLRARRLNPFEAPNPFGLQDVEAAERKLEEAHQAQLRRDGYEL